MGFYKKFVRLYQRLKNPVSLPEDIGKDLGIQVIYNDLNFEQCIEKLSSKDCPSKYLTKFMPREKVERLFKSAVRKEHFKDASLFSYYIYNGWLAFKLTFDDQERLRRVYLQHRSLNVLDTDDGIEMPLN